MAKHMVYMPKLSDTMEEGGIDSWLIEEGSYVEEGDPLCEIETDKATMEYASPESGYLIKILVPKGSQTSLGSPIAVLADTLTDTSADQPDQSDEPLDVTSIGSDDSSHTPDKQTPSPQEPKEKELQKHHDNTHNRLRISPLAAKLARAANIDVTTLTGSGSYGRIVKRDIEAYLETKPPVSTLTSTQLPPQQTSHIEPQTFTEKPRLTEPPTLSQNPQERKIPLSMLRKSIAKNLTASKQNIPHFYLTTTIEMDALLALRKQLNDHFIQEQKQQQNDDAPWKISINDLFAFTLSRSLPLHPALRSSWAGDHIVQRDTVDLAIAVAVPQGLVTPVLSRAEDYGLEELSRKLRELIHGVQGKHRSQFQLSGGCFTLSNLGMSCVEVFSAIINPPQSAILAVGKVTKQPVVKEDTNIKIVSQVSVTLSCDHRVIDGMAGAQFLDTFKNFMEHPALMLR
ncbi:MAG: dihydrolipoamide acetyltransferase family protein [Proteobacteria bacterium]|nr:dihydrolipoamide acetyltransferase family protein [Pseudomonadota bacterium]